jgi:hypothetical protein
MESDLLLKVCGFSPDAPPARAADLEKQVCATLYARYPGVVIGTVHCPLNYARPHRAGERREWVPNALRTHDGPWRPARSHTYHVLGHVGVYFLAIGGDGSPRRILKPQVAVGPEHERVTSGL